MAIDVGRIRTRSAWVLALVYLWLVRPSGRFLVVGIALGAAGLLLRAWAAGSVAKNERLSTGGPYAHLRHPLYLGNLLIGIGLTLPGGHWIWPAAFVTYFAAVYTRLVRDESAGLAERFGDAYREYAARVPGLLPRILPYRPSHPGEPAGFSLSRYRRNREWRAALGFAAGWVALGLKWVLTG